MSLPIRGLDHLIARLGLELDPELLAPALVHRSWCAENPGHPSNERLEFLGDAVLGMVVADHVFRTHHELAEGDLSDIRKAVVSAVALAEVAEELRIGEHLLLGKGEELSGGRDKPSILSDAMEAIIGAVFIADGLDGATKLVLGVLGTRMTSALVDGADHKSRLQELAARLLADAPRYAIDATGPDHARTFHVTVSVAGVVRGHGIGRSKKQAEQAAARDAVAALSERATTDTTDDSDVDDTLREIHHG